MQSQSQWHAAWDRRAIFTSWETHQRCEEGTLHCHQYGMAVELGRLGTRRIWFRLNFNHSPSFWCRQKRVDQRSGRNNRIFAPETWFNSQEVSASVLQSPTSGKYLGYEYCCAGYYSCLQRPQEKGKGSESRDWNWVDKFCLNWLMMIVADIKLWGIGWKRNKKRTVLEWSQETLLDWRTMTTLDLFVQPWYLHSIRQRKYDPHSLQTMFLPVVARLFPHFNSGTHCLQVVVLSTHDNLNLE